jgi:hypothetical protein
VTNLDILTRLVEREPNNDILTAMLTDELMDARDMLRSEADAHVAHVRAVAAEAAQLADAARLMVPGSPPCRALSRIAHAEAGVPLQAAASLLLEPGAAAPLLHPQWDHRGQRYWPPSVITVGAAWVLTTWRYELDMRSSRRRAARRRRELR